METILFNKVVVPVSLKTIILFHIFHQLLSHTVDAESPQLKNHQH